MAKKKEEQRVVNSFEENKELREKIYDDIFGDSDLTDKQKDFVMLYLSNSNSLMYAISKSTKKLYENQKEENNDSNDDWKEATKDY